MNKRKTTGLLLLMCLLLFGGVFFGVWSRPKQSVQAAVKAKKQLYALEITSGVNGVDMKNISAIVITYGNGTSSYSHAIYPKADMDNTYNFVGDDKDNTLRDNVLSEAGEEIDSSSEKYKFMPYSTKTILFVPYHEISYVTNIRIVYAEGTTGRWSLQGMRVVKVTGSTPAYSGNATVSAPLRLSYTGEIIMEMQNSAELSWATGDVLREFTNDYNRNTTSNAYLKNQSAKDTNAYQTYDAKRDDYVVRLDIPDEYMAGLESLVSECNENAEFHKLMLPDLLYVTVWYEDIYGDVQKADIPVISNVYAEAYGQSGRVNGIAQQGEQLAFTAHLYGFKKLITDQKKTNNGISVTVGMDQTTKSCYIATKTIQDYEVVTDFFGSHYEPVKRKNTAGKRAETAEKMQDALSLTNIALYRKADVSLTAKIDNNVLQFAFSDGTWDKSKPDYYYTYTKSTGRSIAYGTTQNFVMTDNMTDNTKNKDVMRTAKKDISTLYLVEIDTADIAEAATTDDLEVSFTYKAFGSATYIGPKGQDTSLSGDLSAGTNTSTKVYSIKDKVTEYYGYWAAEGTDAEHYAYHQGTGRNGKLYFLLSLADVDTFVSATISLNGSDEWQTSGITISRVTSLDARSIAITTKDMHKITWGSNVIQTDREIDRNVETQKLASSAEQVLVRAGKKKTIYFDETKSSTEVEEAEKWDPYADEMSYETASSNLGFGKNRVSYDVDVVVAGSAAANSTDGDCGSKNLFFFRLNFEDGSSAYVQANQQLSSDGFRTGQTERFSIWTNKDYGELVSVDIIPDDTASSSNIYDKLNITKIRVSKNGDNALNRAWEISNPGWVGIDYVEDAQDNSNVGSSNKTGRYAGELTKSFMVDRTTYSVRLMFAFSTGEYKDGKQFGGSIQAELSYIDTNNELQILSFDMVKQLYNYNQKETTGISTRTLNGKTSYVPDTGLMFRGNTVDRFFLDLSDVKSIESMKLTVTDQNGVTWNINDVGVSLVSQTGQMILNSNGEYVYTGETKELTTQESTTSPAYSVSVTGGDISSFNINFLPNEIAINQSESAASAKVTRKPAGNNDTLNVYLLPREDSRVWMNDYNMRLNFSYVNSYGAKYANGINSMKKNSEAYYIEGISTRSFSMLDSVQYRAIANSNSGSTLGASEHIGGKEMIIQQVRAGVILNTFWGDLANVYLDNPDNTVVLKRYTDQRTQTVSLYFGKNTKTERLSNDGKNIAVSIGFETTVGGKSQKYHSPYVYLTDEDIEQIHAGMIADVNFHIPYISKITDVRVAGVKDVTAEIDSILISTYDNDSSADLTLPEYGSSQEVWDQYNKEKEKAQKDRICDSWYSISSVASEDRMLTNGVTTYSYFRSDVDETGTLTPVTITLEAAENMVDSDADLEMVILYKKKGTGQDAEKSIDSVRQLLGSDSTFRAGETQTIQCMLTDVDAIIGLKLKTTQEDKFYTIKSAKVEWDKIYTNRESQMTLDHMVRSWAPSNQEGEIITNKTFDVSFANAKLTVTASSEPADGSSGVTMSSSDVDEINLLLKEGDKLNLDIAYTSSLDDTWSYDFYRLSDNARASVDSEKSFVKTQGSRLVVHTTDLRSGNYLLVIKGESSKISCNVKFTVEAVESDQMDQMDQTDNSEQKDTDKEQTNTDAKTEDSTQTETEDHSKQNTEE